MNVLHKYRLVQAERYRVLGCRLEAMEAYEQAITLAQENDYLNEEALAHELAGLFYLSWGKTVIAQTYLINAYYAYERWGAKAKLADLEQRHPSLLSYFENNDTRLAPSSLNTSSLSSKSDLLDWASVLRATQTLSQEMDQNRLLRSILKVIIENAGAEQGSLLLHETERLILKSHCDQADSEEDCERSLTHTVNCLTPSLTMSSALKLLLLLMMLLWIRDL
jgi:GAF domain-containing protein